MPKVPKKKCPFCGAYGIIEELPSDYYLDKFKYRITCVGPLSHSLDHWSDTEDEAIEMWDTRSSDQDNASNVVTFSQSPMSSFVQRRF